MRLTVIVPRIIFVPNVFSPNGDGHNDYFTIFGRFNLVNINKLNIYDRWGNQLFGKTDLTPGQESLGWDGTFQDKEMQSGVYVYVAELKYEDGVVETVTGSITLTR
jgi:gliding motility-associated-like protein